jgi:integrase
VALTAKRVERLLSKGEPAMKLDERGLYLVVESETNAYWGFRYQLNGRAHLMGLGSARTFTLALARLRAQAERALLADGVDPIEAKRKAEAARKAAAAIKLTFKEASERFIAQHEVGWTARHAHEFQRTLKDFVWPRLGTLDVAEIAVPHVLSVLEQKVEKDRNYPAGEFWEARTATADRTRNRIETVLDYAAARGHRPKGPNPAAWRGNLEFVLPKPSKVLPRDRHHSAVPFDEVPALMSELARREGNGAKALRFLILCAARSAEALNATWDEIDLEKAEWKIPAKRMKGRREHRVPLSAEAVALLRELYTEEGNPLVFIGERGALGLMTMYQVLRRVGRKETIHGFRSGFSDWAHERTAFSNHVIELSLAHSIGTAAEKAYRRSDLFQKRRQLMQAWARYCTTPPVEVADDKVGTVVPMRGAR